MPTFVDRVAQLWRWIAARPPIVFVLCGWGAFCLGAYPGYLDHDAIIQLASVRSGDYTDATSSIVTLVWKLLELVVAGPFGMLALQSGVFVFGVAAILRTRVTPRAAAIAAVGILLAPPVFAPMAVIWPDSLMAAALVAAVAMVIGPRSRARLAAAGVALVVASSCRPEIAVALVPIVLLVLPQPRWRRLAIAIAVAAGISGVAYVGDQILTDTTAYTSEQRVMLPDIVGTLRRARIDDVHALDGLRVVDDADLREHFTTGSDALNWLPLAYGPKRLFDLIATDDEAAAMRATWRRVIADHPGAYLDHRATMMRNLLGVTSKWSPVYDSYGDPGLLIYLHHRATPSDWQLATRAFVRAIAITPLFRPVLYLVIAIGLVAWLRRDRVLRALVISGVIYELTLFVFAADPAYRYSHWLVSTTWIAAVALAVERRWRRA